MELTIFSSHADLLWNHTHQPYDAAKERRCQRNRLMSYYISTKLDTSFDDAINRVTDALQKEGFGILTEIDVQATLKKKLDVEFRPYKILGACNPSFAHQALQEEEQIGAMLPCNVVVQDKEGEVVVAAVDPIASMQAVENPRLVGIAQEVQARLKSVIESL